MEFENLVKISSMVNAIYCNIQETSCDTIEDDVIMSEQIGKLEDDLKSIHTIFDANK